METPTNPRDPSSSLPAAAADPRWVMLNCYGCGARWDNEPRVVVACAETVAESRTSTGRHFRVSLGLEPPPAWSYLYHAMVGSAPSTSAVDNDADADAAGFSDFSRVVAAHGDSVLFVMTTTDGAADYFVYSAGGGGGTSGRPPRLILLPDCHVRNDDDDESGRSLDLSDTGLLRRGEDELLVAQLDVPFGEQRDTAELCVLRVGGGAGGGSGTGGWELTKAVPIVQEHGGKVPVLRYWWQSVAVIPVGDRYLCWLNYLTGFLFCDMATSPLKLRYVRLPADLVGDDDDDEADEEYDSPDLPSMKHSRNMCAAGAGAVRLVSVDSRCCCGGRVLGWTSCKRSRFAFMVTTWTLELRTTMTAEEEEEPMRWVQDGVLDCDELWALPEYGSLPRVPLEYPVVSSDDPDVVCFRVRNDYSGYREDRKDWLLEVDTRRKKLLSVLPTTIPFAKQDTDNIQAKFYY